MTHKLQTNMKKTSGIKSKCCNSPVLESWNKRNAGNEQEFWCEKCDKECEFYTISKSTLQTIRDKGEKEFDDKFTIIDLEGNRIVKPRPDEDDGDGGYYRSDGIVMFLNSQENKMLLGVREWAEKQKKGNSEPEIPLTGEDAVEYQNYNNAHDKALKNLISFIDSFVKE